MIHLTKITGEDIVVNPDQIEVAERRGDTVVTLNSGNKLIVREDLHEITARVLSFRAAIITKAQET